jgi:hypothetical protein
MKNLKDLIGNRKHHLSACSAVLRTTAPPHTLFSFKSGGTYYHWNLEGLTEMQQLKYKIWFVSHDTEKKCFRVV